MCEYSIHWMCYISTYRLRHSFTTDTSSCTSSRTPAIQTGKWEPQIWAVQHGALPHLDLRGFSLGRWRWGCVKLVLLFQSMISKAARVKPVLSSVEGLRIFISHWFRLVGWTHQQYHPEGKWNTWTCSDSLPCTGFGSQVWLHNAFDWNNYGFEFLV